MGLSFAMCAGGKGAGETADATDAGTAGDGAVESCFTAACIAGVPTLRRRRRTGGEGFAATGCTLTGTLNGGVASCGDVVRYVQASNEPKRARMTMHVNTRNERRGGCRLTVSTRRGSGGLFCGSW